jgi:hypothetical protein
MAHWPVSTADQTRDAELHDTALLRSGKRGQAGQSKRCCATPAREDRQSGGSNGVPLD